MISSIYTMLAIIHSLYKFYLRWKLRKREDWIPMIMAVTTKNAYWEVVNSMFEDKQFTYRRLLVLEIFTKDLCEVHGTQLFMKQYRFLN